MFEIVFSIPVKDNINFPCLYNIRLSYNIYRNVSVLCQSDCACLHTTVNMVIFFFKSNENTYTKCRQLIQMYRVVPKTKLGEKDTATLLNPHQ